MRIIAGLPAKLQLQARNAVVLHRCTCGADPHAQGPFLGDAVTYLHGEFLARRDNGHMVVFGGYLWLCLAWLPGVPGTRVTPISPRGPAGRELFVVRVIRPDTKSGPPPFQFLFQLGRIVFVLLPDLLQLSILFGPLYGCCSSHRNAPIHQCRLRPLNRCAFEGITTQLPVRRELDRRHVQQLGTVLKTIFRS